MTSNLPRWDAYAVHLIRDQGWRGIPEAAAISILTASRIPLALLTLTFLEIMEQAGHIRKPHPEKMQIIRSEKKHAALSGLAA